MTNKQAATKVVHRLREEGYQALFAGGCVRDMLLGRQAKDYDVVTDARPKQVMDIFRRTLEIGAQFGVVVVMLKKHQVEVATFRTESGYADGRHPQEVHFSNAREDAARRDFTINGMFYDPVAEQVYDYVGGQTDLDRQVIRTIGEPHERFSEDFLRMLRAVRFATQLDFEIDPATWNAVRELAGNITRISGERIGMELEAMLISPNRARGARLLIENELADQIFPEIDPNELTAGIGVLEQLPNGAGYELTLAGLFSACKSAAVINSLAVIRPSNALIKHVQFLLDNRGVLLEDDMRLARLRLLLAEPYFDDLYEYQLAIQKAKGESVKPLETIRSRAQELKGTELTPDPLLDGHELMKLGVKPGPMVGEVAREMYLEQLDNRLRTRQKAEEWVRNRINSDKTG
ncbi:CCA tRNA nucleotidyltransferase [Anaerohalosphaera lusitana]|nr:CCA tRNA nucleotidyltransferase [Anaerohalosphaera lusitana]